jgi:glycosyltransferase involved in cell wall biosynthesis
VHYIDMTMAQVARQWPKWAPFESSKVYDKWIEVEGESYRRALRVFTFSEVTRQSVITDYKVPAERVVAVGAAGHYQGVSETDRTYGNRSIIFNGSDFIRKGGDLVLAAFRIIRKRFPGAILRIVANTTDVVPEDGVTLFENLTRAELFKLMEVSDVVLAPSRMDVLPGFVCEAMSHGIVPVLSNVPSMDEMVQNGEEGYVVTPTPENLAAHVIQLFENESLLASMGAASKRRVAKDWNWDAVVKRMADSLADDN